MTHTLDAEPMRHSSRCPWMAIAVAVLATACQTRCPEDTTRSAAADAAKAAPAADAPPGAIARGAANAPTDPAVLADAVRRELEGALRDEEVLVLVDGRAVTLTGRVDDPRAARRAITAARVAGAAEVRSRLVAAK